jgi:DNA-binding beta-propeller fold protein YncE
VRKRALTWKTRAFAVRIGLDGIVSSFAGSGEKGHADGPAAQAKFNYPGGIAVDADDNIIVADYGNHRVRKIRQDGVVQTVAGSGEEGHRDGPALSAMFCFPQGVAVKPASGEIVVTDFGNDMIRAIGTNGLVRTIAGTGETGFEDGPGEAATFNQPRGVACDPHGTIYVADRGNHAIRVIDEGDEDGECEVTTIAGYGVPIDMSAGAAGRHGGDDGCEDACCVPAPMQRTLYCKRAREEEVEAVDAAGAGGGGAAPTKPKITPFGVLDATWG